MPIPLVRRPIDVDVTDADAIRAWLLDRIRQEVLLKGCPHPKILLLGRGFEEQLDLDAMTKKDRGAHMGATFQALRSRPNIERRFVSMLMTTGDDDEAERTFALLFEEIDAFDGRRWWMATLAFTQDPTTGLGIPASEWAQSNGETNNPAHLMPFLREIAFPTPGSRATQILAPGDTWQPDIQFAFGDLAEGAPTPATAKEMVELTQALAVNQLLTGEIQGTVVVRLAGRSWEKWLLKGEMPGPLQQMVRWIANDRDPAADAVAVALMAIRPKDKPPVVGMQVIAEFDGKYCETWAPIGFPEGPSGQKTIDRTDWWYDRPVPAEGMWLGIASGLPLSLPTEES